MNKSDDMISRQAAIDAVMHAWAKGLEPTQFLEDLPSTEPEKADCDTCKHGRFGSVQCNRCSVGFPNNYEKDERYG